MLHALLPVRVKPHSGSSIATNLRAPVGLTLLLAAHWAVAQVSTNNIGTNAVASTSYVSSWENLLAIQDGRDPVSSTDKTGGAYGNWPTTGTNWVEYQWPSTTWP